MSEIFKGQDNLVRWDCMKLASTGSFVNDATVTFTLKNAAGTAITGADTISMTTQNQSGRYDGTLESTVDIDIGTKYFIEITATRGDDKGFRRFKVTAQYQGETG